MRATGAALMCLFVVGCAATAPQGQPMSAEDFIAVARGNTQEGRSASGASWRIYIADDLSRRGIVFLPNRQMRITGSTVATADGVCSASPEIRNGETRCFRMFRNGETFQSVYNGAVDSTFRIVPGNPYEL